MFPGHDIIDRTIEEYVKGHLPEGVVFVKTDGPSGTPFDLYALLVFRLITEITELRQRVAELEAK